MTSTHDTTDFAPLRAHNVTLPDHLVVRTVADNLFNVAHAFGYNGEQMFGIAFIQGKRLQFTTALSVKRMLDISQIDRAPKGSGVKEVEERANRPKVQSHGIALRKYFENTACRDEKFILPAFAFNFGDESTIKEDAPDAVLWILAKENDNSVNGWPALFQLPNAIKLDTTDGAHRGDEMNTIINKDPLRPDGEKALLSRNACDIKIIFERKRIDAHQDFADCAKAKPITGSLISTFDVRDVRNSNAVKLAHKVPFLQHYVDATASNVNLSAGSAKIWSMASLRGFVGHIQDHYPPPLGADGPTVAKELDEKMEGADDLFDALIKYMPQLRALDLARMDSKKHTETPATFRNKRGGDIALRGIGMSLFARAFIYAKTENVPYDVIAKRLGAVDWHLLDCERDDLPNTDTAEGRLVFADAVRQHLLPTWGSMIVIGENRYRIGSSNDEANSAWERITEKWPEVVAKLAAKLAAE